MSRPLVLSNPTAAAVLVLAAFNGVISRASRTDQARYAQLLERVVAEDKERRTLTPFVAAAKELAVPGELEFDDQPMISISERDLEGKPTSAYVQAWAYIDLDT